MDVDKKLNRAASWDCADFAECHLLSYIERRRPCFATSFIKILYHCNLSVKDCQSAIDKNIGSDCLQTNPNLS